MLPLIVAVYVSLVAPILPNPIGDFFSEAVSTAGTRIVRTFWGHPIAPFHLHTRDYTGPKSTLVFFMSERKAINKYYPPDWDPSQAPKKRKNNNPNAEKVRLMLPFSMKCLQCNEYIALRRKFNARKEITAEKYMGIKIIRFHIKCPRCNNGIVFRTDPKSAGFAPVEGGLRNYESLAPEVKIKPMETEDEIFERLEREDVDNKKFQEQREKRKHNPFWQTRHHDDKNVMESLEDKLAEQQQEQEIHDHLAYLQAKSLRLQQSGGIDHVTTVLRAQVANELAKQKREFEDEDTEEAKKVKGSFGNSPILKPAIVSGVITVKRPKLSAHKIPVASPSVLEEKGIATTKTSSSATGKVTSSAVLALAGYSSSDEE